MEQRNNAPWPDEPLHHRLNSFQELGPLLYPDPASSSQFLPEQLAPQGPMAALNNRHISPLSHPTVSSAISSAPAQLANQLNHHLTPSYNLAAEMRQRQLQQERAAQMQHQLSCIAQHWQQKWVEHQQAMANTKQVFNRLLDELPSFCDALNRLLYPETLYPPMYSDKNALLDASLKLQWQIDGDRSVGILDFMGFSITLMMAQQRQPLVLPRLGRSPLLCARIVALQGNVMDTESVLYALEFSETLTSELASLYVGADVTAPVVMRLIADNPAQVSEEVFFYPHQAPAAFLTKLLERLGQCPQFHETVL